MEFLVGTGVLVTKDDTTPTGIGSAITHKFMHGVEIVVTALVFSRLSYVDGRTGVFGMHKLVTIGLIERLLIVRIDFYFIILIIFIFVGIPMCPLRFLLLLDCQYFLVEVLFVEDVVNVV
jgi:hypothetical protein